MSLLERTLTVRQLVKAAGWLVGALILAYVGLAIADSWRVQNIGVSAKNSPIAALLPEKCQGYVNQSTGIPSGRTASDGLLLRGRVHRYQLKAALENPANRVFECLGYSVMAGLHSEEPGSADFADYFLDDHGEAVVIVRVEYRKQVNLQGKR
jgi:hypothetical protein